MTAPKTGYDAFQKSASPALWAQYARAAFPIAGF